MRNFYSLLVSSIVFLFSACDSFSNEDKLKNNSKKKEELVTHSAFSGDFEGVWIQTYPSDYRPMGFKENEGMEISPGVYAKLKIHHGIFKIWYLEGSELSLEEYRKFECIKEKCVPKEPIGKYDHQLKDFKFIFVSSERFIVKGDDSLFTSPKGCYFLRVKQNNFDENKYPFFNAINTQAEINLPGI